MKGIAKAFTVVWLLSGVHSAEATVPSISLETLSAAGFDSLSTDMRSSFGFNSSLEMPSYDWSLLAQLVPEVPTIEERRFQQNMRELTASLQNYADQIPDKIQIGWIECFTSAEDRQSRVNSVVSQWSTSDPIAALEWISNIVSSEGRQLNSVASQWSNHDPIAASEWLVGIDLSEDRRDRLSSIISQRMNTIFDTTSSQVNSVPEPKTYGLLAGLLSFALVAFRRQKGMTADL